MTQQLTSHSDSTASFYIAKSNICVNSKGESIGHGVFVRRDFNAGEQITVFKRPLVGSLDTERLKDTCANCYIWTEGSSTGTRLYVPEGSTVQKCAGCQRFHYCSKVGNSRLLRLIFELNSARHVKRPPGTAATSTNASF